MWPTDSDPSIAFMKKVMFWGIVATGLFGLVVFVFFP
jgi:hypothetical protein